MREWRTSRLCNVDGEVVIANGRNVLVGRAVTKKNLRAERVDGTHGDVLLSDFDRRAMLQVRTSAIAPNSGLFGCREIGNAVAV